YGLQPRGDRLREPLPRLHEQYSGGRRVGLLPDALCGRGTCAQHACRGFGVLPILKGGRRPTARFLKGGRRPTARCQPAFGNRRSRTAWATSLKSSVNAACAFRRASASGILKSADGWFVTSVSLLYGDSTNLPRRLEMVTAFPKTARAAVAPRQT